MNQHGFVKGCLGFYQNEGLTPEKGWEEAHYPAPEEKGEATVWMTHDHHQVQGLLQSREYDQCCFFKGDTKRFLIEGPFVPGWFELWDIYDKYSTLQSSSAGRKGGTKAAELGVGIHAPGVRSKGGTKAAEKGVGVHAPGKQSKGGKKAAELGVGIHAPEMRGVGGKKGGKRGSKTTNSQKWQSTDPNHPAHISNSGGLSSWQKARGIDTKMRVKVG
jgi:hypothetical protein